MSIARHHTEWLSLVPVSGPFLSLPVLMEAFPQGLDAHDPDHFRLLRQEYETWLDSLEEKRGDPAPHYNWIKFVITKTLDLDEQVLLEGQTIPQTLQIDVPEHQEFLRPSIVVVDPATKKPRLLVQTHPQTQDLTSYVAGSSWKTSPDTRMTHLLQATGVRLGLITNGEHWMLVNAKKGETTGYASWFGSLWLEEKITLQAFRSLLSASRFFNVPDEQTLEALLDKSASNQQEVTDQLGYQVRRAVEVLIHEIAKIEHEPEIDAELRKLISEIPEAVLYESALTVMMRLVFLFCAEERELIPSKPFPVYEQNYSVATISKQLRELADQHDEALLERRYDAWPRLLSAFRAVYGGLRHDDVHIPAYGGSLFNPDRFPFVEGRKSGTSWRDVEASPLPVSNRTVLHLLEALQYLETKVPGSSEKTLRRLSFRALDIEQIGQVYEGLLDHTAKRATEPFLGLDGTKDKEPEIPLAVLEEKLAKGEEDLLKFLKGETGKSESALKKLLKSEIDTQDVAKLRTACQSDDALWIRVQPFAGLVRLDNFEYPVVIPKGHVFVTAGTDRRSSGTHYTPKSLTEPIVQYVLEPLVYVGPAEGKPKGEWKLKSAKELLDLKICDMACGSGAFLVQAARYMAERLMEAWDFVKLANPNTPGITPDGEPSTGKANESLIPDDPAERKTYAMRIIAQRCLYGVDINPLAAEMTKLSLWLLTVAKDKPFEFLDHSIRCGDSLVGLHSIHQLRHFSLKPDADDAVLFKGPLDSAVDEAITLRLKLEDLPANSVVDVERQEKLLKEADDKIARLRCSADLLVSAEFWGENAKDKQERVRHAAVVSGHYIEKGPTEEFQRVASKERRGQKMFHWPLEFPEVIVKRGGFDAFVGNPPFRPGRFLSGDLGETYLAYLQQPPFHHQGQADLCSAFARRGFCLLNARGLLGMIVTKTISEGDTREAFLVPSLEAGGQLTWVRKIVWWPGDAQVVVSLMVIARNNSTYAITLDGKIEEGIDSTFSATSMLGVTPFVLESSKCLVGKGVGLGSTAFRIPTEELHSLRQIDPIHARRFVRGTVHNSSIDGWGGEGVYWFEDIDSEDDLAELEIASGFLAQVSETKSDKFWKYRRNAEKHHQHLRETSCCIIRAQTSSTWFFTFWPSDDVFDQSIISFGANCKGLWSILSSNIHFAWVAKYGRLMKTDTAYSPSDFFYNFPLPYDPMHDSNRNLADLALAYQEARSAFCSELQIGMTDLFSRMNDPQNEESHARMLREHQKRIDTAVRDAYGFHEIDLDHDFRDSIQGVRFTISEPARREVLLRLLKLNHERYTEEVRQGLHGKKGAAKKAASKKETASKPAKNESTLFDMGDDEE